MADTRNTETQARHPRPVRRWLRVVGWVAFVVVVAVVSYVALVLAGH